MKQLFTILAYLCLLPNLLFATDCTHNCEDIDTNINNYNFLGTYEGHAYYQTGKANYDEALSLAQDLGGYLVTINDQDENDWLQVRMAEVGSYWIGLSDEEEEGNWIWLNDEPADFINWATGEPNNSNNAEHYARAKTNGKWTDRPASNNFRVVVEVPCPCIDENVPCSVDLTVRNEGLCDIQLFAAILPGVEIPITTIPPNVQLVFDATEGDMWVVRANGDPSFEIQYTVEGCNNQSLIANPCLSIGNNDCSNADPNLENFDLLGTFDGSIYYLYENGSVNYDEALDIAISIGGTLPIITSQEENDWLRSLVNDAKSYWLYLSDEGSEGNFYWLDDTPINYLNWANNEPNNSNNNEHYGRVREDGKWTDRPASVSYYTVVEVPCSNTNCDCSNFTPENIPNYNFLGEFDGQFYYERTTGDVDYATALSYAAELEGTLPVVSSQEQNEWLRERATSNQSYWLAFSDENDEGNYYWLDGTPVTYTNWKAGEPNDSTASHNYARVKPNGSWTDKPESDTYLAIIAINCPCNERHSNCNFQLNCPNDLVVLCDNEQGTNVFWNAPTLPPNCTGFINQIEGPEQGSLFLEGTTTTISYVYVSDTKTTTRCSFTIRIPDCDEGARLDNSNGDGDCDDDSVICNVVAFPNPTQDFVNLTYFAHYNLEANISLYDVMGQRLNSQNMIGEKGTNYVQLDLTSYTKGVYYVQVQMRGVTKIVKVIKL